MSIASRPNVAVVGAGPAGLMAAEVLAGGGAAVTVYDRMPSAGRKFLLAGRGGLNLTHSEAARSAARPLRRRGAASARRDRGVSARRRCAPGARDWDSRHSSGRAGACSRRRSRPRRCCAPGCGGSMRLASSSSRVTVGRGWDGGGADIRDAARPRCGRGGRDGAGAGRRELAAAWLRRRLGRRDDEAGIAVAPLRPANCGFIVEWSEVFRERFEGQPLKRIALSFGGAAVRGEAIITARGLEGGGIYALSAPLREAIAARGEAVLQIDLRPDLTAERSGSGASPCRAASSRSRPSCARPPRSRPRPSACCTRRRSRRRRALSAMHAAALAELIKAVPVRLTGVARHRPGDLDRRRHCLRRGRREFHAPPQARRVRRRRNARLGGADRRLSAAGVLRDRRGGRTRCTGTDVERLRGG